MEKRFFILLIFLAGLIFTNFVSARSVQCDLDNPIGIWRFNEGTGMMTNESCFGYEGYLAGDINWTDGVFGKSIRFNGANTWVDAGNFSAQTMANFSFSIWVNISYEISYRTLFQRGNYYTPEFVEVINMNDGGSDFILFMGSSSDTIAIADDGKWHNIIGTFDGGTGNSSLYIDGNFITTFYIGQSEVSATTNNFYFGLNYANGFVMNGVLDEGAFFDRVLTSQEIFEFSNSSELDCSKYPLQIQFSSQPYVGVGELETVSLNLNPFFNNANFDFTINDGMGNISIFNMNKSNNFTLVLSFGGVGNYNYILSSSDVCYKTNTTGILFVREPFYIIINGYEDKNTTKYINNFAYVTAEYGAGKRYDGTLEKYLTPLMFADLFKTPVFHANYNNGQAVLKLYDANVPYTLRLWDGIATFPCTYSIPNISKTYGVNVYLGQITPAGNETLNVLLDKSDTAQYTYLFNYIFVGILGLIILISIILFFIFPEVPILGLGFGLGLSIMLVIFRIVIWLFYW